MTDTRSIDPEENLETPTVDDLLTSFGAKLYQDPVRDHMVTVHSSGPKAAVLDPLRELSITVVARLLVDHIKQIESPDDLKNIKVILVRDYRDANLVGREFLHAFVNIFHAIGAKEKELEMKKQNAADVQALQQRHGVDLTSIRERQMPVYNRTEAGQAYIKELRAQQAAGTGKVFNSEVLAYLDQHPEGTIRTAWEFVERGLADIKRSAPRAYPFEFEN